MNRAWISIDYDEGDQATYRAVEVAVREEKPVRFETCDPVSDWKSAIHHAANSECDFILFSSSVDHFTMDGDRFKWCNIAGVDILERA